MKIIQKKANIDHLPQELDIELSIIDSGMIISEINGKVVFVLKDSVSIATSLKELLSVSLKFTYIERPEFPTINSELRLKTTKKLSIKYDYFFNSESEYDMNLLYEILNRKVISLFLFSDIVIKHLILELDEEESIQLTEILNQYKS